MIPCKSHHTLACLRLDNPCWEDRSACSGWRVGCVFAIWSRFVLQPSERWKTSQQSSDSHGKCISVMHRCFVPTRNFKIISKLSYGNLRLTSRPLKMIILLLNPSSKMFCIGGASLRQKRHKASWSGRFASIKNIKLDEIELFTTYCLQNKRFCLLGNQQKSQQTEFPTAKK